MTRPLVTGPGEAGPLATSGGGPEGDLGPLVNGGMKKVRDPRNSTAAKKVSEGAAKDMLKKSAKVLPKTCSSEGAAKDMLKYPFKNSHQNLLDRLAKKLLTVALVKLKQRGVLIYDSREVSCSRQREIR